MPETFTIYHKVGCPGGQLRTYPMPTLQQPLLAGSTYARFSLSRVEQLPNDSASTPIPIITAVTGSGSAQSVNVSYTGGMDVGQWWVAEPGTALQEVFEMAVPTDATHILVTLQNNHAVGAPIMRVHSMFTRSLVVGMTGVGTPISNFNFLRMGPLPANVYDQIIMNGSLGTFNYAPDDIIPWINGSYGVASIPLRVPQYDPAIVSATGNPTNGLVLDAGTISSSGQIYPQPRVQFLITTTPEPSFNVDYAGWWDN